MIACAVEAFADAVHDIVPLIDEHWDEVGSFKDGFRRNIDLAAYHQLERQTRLLTVTLRNDEGAMVGYFVGAIGLDLHRVTDEQWPKRVYACSALVYYIVPAKRGYARTFIKAIEQAARDRGCTFLSFRVKPGLNEADAFFDKIGYVEVERTRTRILGDPAHAGLRPAVDRRDAS